MELPKIRTFTDKVAEKIQKEKRDNHIFVIVSSGTAFRISDEVAKKYPANLRGQTKRTLFYQWSEGQQTLLGLKAIVKEHVLIYKDLNVNSIVSRIKFDIKDNFTCKWVIVPDEIRSTMANNINLHVLGFSECLFLD